MKKLFVAFSITEMVFIFFVHVASAAWCPNGYPFFCEDTYGEMWCCYGSEYIFFCDDLVAFDQCIPYECIYFVFYAEDSEKLELARDFRDNVLSQSPLGQELIKLYYQWSPLIIQAMEKDEGFKEEVKGMIDRVLGVIEKEAE